MTTQLFEDQISALELHLKELVPQLTVDFVIKYENELTLSEIKACVEDVSTTKEFEQSLKTILAARWKRICHTPMCYTQAPFNPVNRFCLDLANQLSPLPNTQDEIADLTIGEGPYFILMPSLGVATDVSGANIHEYKLHQFVLSDDARLFIPLQLCLDYATDRQQGFTHVTSTDINQYPILTPTEQERISNHSTPVYDYLQSILKLQKTKQIATELGPQLIRLIEALRQGGAKKKGTELNSGAEANTGIVKFSEYWDTLRETTKKECYEKYSDYRQTGFEIVPHPGLKTLIGRLMKPYTASYIDTIYCVELIAEALERLIKHYGITTSDITAYEDHCQIKKRHLSELINQEFDYKLLPSKMNYHKLLPQLFQLPSDQQKEMFKSDQCEDAWAYALKHAPSTLVDFVPVLTATIMAKRDSKGNNILDIAIAYYPELLELLLLKAMTLNPSQQKELLKNIVYSEYQYADHSSVLHYIYSKHPKFINKVIDENVKQANIENLNTKHSVWFNRYNRNIKISTLCLLAQEGDITNIQKLLDAGVALNPEPQEAVSALIAATINNKLECVTFLLKKNIKINQQDMNGNTALYHAVQNGNPQIQEVLLNHKATFAMIEESKLSMNTSMTLYALNFDEHLEKFKAIETLMLKKCENANILIEKNDKHKPTYQAAANAAKILCQTLTTAKDEFLKTHNKKHFLTCCKNAIDNAQELTKHRGCKLVLAEFLRNILSLISKKAVAVLTNKYHLFAPKTASEKKLDLFANRVSDELSHIYPFIAK